MFIVVLDIKIDLKRIFALQNLFMQINLITTWQTILSDEIKNLIFRN
jgi:hypothetical protein